MKPYPSLEYCPSLIVRTAVRQHYITQVTGSLVLFSNRRGISKLRIDNRELVLRPGSFALSLPGETFTRDYQAAHTVETFNVHFNRELVCEIEGAIRRPRNIEPEASGRSQLLPLLRSQSEPLQRALNHLAAACEVGAMAIEQALCKLLSYLLNEAGRYGLSTEKLSSINRATRVELARRISRAVDYMHAYYDQSLSLKQLARVSCLSQFHFLRSFKELVGMTPLQFLRELRLTEVRRLLTCTGMPLHVIAARVGYSDASAVSRAFARRFHYPPSALRPAHT